MFMMYGYDGSSTQSSVEWVAIDSSPDGRDQTLIKGNLPMITTGVKPPAHVTVTVTVTLTLTLTRTLTLTLTLTIARTLTLTLKLPTSCYLTKLRS